MLIADTFDRIKFRELPNSIVGDAYKTDSHGTIRRTFKKPTRADRKAKIAAMKKAKNESRN